MRYLFSIVIFIIILAISSCSDDKQTTTTQNTASSSISQTNPSRSDTFDIPFTEDPATATIEYPDMNIYYEYDGIIYSYNPKTKEKKEIIHGHSPFLSHDKTKFAYFPEETLKDASQGSFYIYNIVTKENNFLLSNTESPNFQYEMWSPDDKYLVFDTGTYVNRSKIVYDAITGKEILYIEVHEADYGWISNDKIVYTDVASNSISIIDMKNKTKKELLKGDKNIFYSFISIQKDKNIYFEKYDRNNENLSVFYTINIDGDNLTKIKETHETMEYFAELRKEYYGKDYDEFQKIFFNSLGEKDNNKYTMNLKQLQPDSNWSLIIIDSPREVFRYPSIFILDKNNPKSLKKLGNWNSAQW